MTGIFLFSIALLSQSGSSTSGFQALPRHPCIAPGTGGVYYETSSVEWSWSPSGEAIVYDRALGRVSQLRARHLESSEERCLTSGEFYDTQPSWSPDGERIAFVRGRGEGARIHLLGVRDGSAQPVTDPNRRSEYPTFSPDGSKLAYVRFAEGNTGRRFVVVRDLATAEETVVFDSPEGLNNLSWTPDGKAVSLYSIDEDGWNDVYEARADGSGVRRLTDNTITDAYSAAYAADGTRMIFGQGSEVSPFHRWFNYDLYEKHLTSGAVRRLTWAFNADDRAHYSPDGETIGFVTRRSGYAEIYVMDADGGNLRQITRQPEGELTTLIESEGLPAGEGYFQRIRSEEGDAELLGDRAAAVLVHRYLARGLTDEAVRVARMGVATHPGSWWAQTSLGRALLAAGESEAGKAALRRSLSIFPNQYQVVFALGFADFVRTLDSIEGIYRDRGVEVFELARWLLIRGELPSAVSLLHRLDAAHPDDPDVIGRVAYTQMVLGDHANAVLNYRRVLEIDPDREEAQFHLRRIEGLEPTGNPGEGQNSSLR